MALPGLPGRALRAVAEDAELDFAGAGTVAWAGAEGKSTAADEGSERGKAGALTNAVGAGAEGIIGAGLMGVGAATTGVAEGATLAGGVATAAGGRSSKYRYIP